MWLEPLYRVDRQWWQGRPVSWPQIQRKREAQRTLPSGTQEVRFLASPRLISCVVVKCGLKNLYSTPTAPTGCPYHLSCSDYGSVPSGSSASTLPPTVQSLTRALQWLLLDPTVNSTILSLLTPYLIWPQGPSQAFPSNPLAHQAAPPGSLCRSNLPSSVLPQGVCTLLPATPSPCCPIAGLISTFRSHFKFYLLRGDFPDRSM